MYNKKIKKPFVIGYGNRYRQDDGLGYELVRMLKKDYLNEVIFVHEAQLSVDLAYEISESESDVVFFIDADSSIDKPFSFYPVYPCKKINFSVSSIRPETVIYFCQSLFNKEVNAFMVGIRGYEWDFSADISPMGIENLNKAHTFLCKKIDSIIVQKYLLEPG